MFNFLNLNLIVRIFLTYSNTYKNHSKVTYTWNTPLSFSYQLLHSSKIFNSKTLSSSFTLTRLFDRSGKRLKATTPLFGTSSNEHWMFSSPRPRSLLTMPVIRISTGTLDLGEFSRKSNVWWMSLASKTGMKYNPSWQCGGQKSSS